MIQFNLLPAVKLEYVKAQRTKHLTVLVATIAAGASLAIVVLLFLGVQVAQKKHSQDLSKDIKDQSAALKEVDDFDKILTIQNQLGSLTSIHDQKPVTTRLLGYITQLTPANVSVASLNVDFETKTMLFKGSADALSSVNTFVDTLKFTTYKAADGTDKNAFSQVVLSGFGKDDKGASYQVALIFDPEIFSSGNNVTLNVPNKTTTRSQTEKPEALFQPLSNEGNQ